MNITIEIECETVSDFYAHLSTLQKNIKKQAKKLKLDPIRDKFPETVELDDSNCYGDHTVKITHLD